jgi:hypothetical protein
MGSQTTTLLSATSNGNATKYLIPAMDHLLNRTNPCGLQKFVRHDPRLNRVARVNVSDQSF